ncbi:MAG: response regulator [Akkermansiaceae bacterium]|nr:response regulator [Verrucomicrobiales bacterium]
MNGKTIIDREKGKLRLLVVDDEPNVCECVRLILSLDGHAVVTAHSGRAALEKFQTEQFDLVCTDYSMPGMRGDQLAVAIKSLAPDQPIIMISGIASTMSIPAGVDKIIGKPFMPAELRQAVTQLTRCEATS